MGTTSQKLTYLSGTKDRLKTTINYAGAGLTNETFRQYPEKLYDKYLDILKDDGEELFASLPKATGTGTSITLNNTANTRMKMSLTPSELSQSGTPTPESPQDIHTISGDNEIVVGNKNLVYNVVVDTNNTYKNAYVYPKSITQNMTFSFNPNGMASVYFNYKVYADEVAIRNDSVKSVVDTRNSKSYTFTQEELNTLQNADIVYFQIQRNNGISYPIDFQVENNTTTATTYVSHQQQTLPLTLGTLEYCKIGNYADEFYLATESDTSLVAGKWYLKKNIGKVVLDGSFTWTYTNNCFQSQTTFPINIGDITTGAKFTQYTFKYYPSSITSNLQNNEFGWNSNKRLTIKDTRYSNSADFNSALAQEQPILYYPTQTPEYTLLNDTLQEELNNIKKALSYDTQTNISQVNNDLPFVISASAIKEYELN